MRCWGPIPGRWSAPIAIRPTRICRCDAGTSAGRICGAPSRSSWPGEERPPGSGNGCWIPATRCLTGGTGSATAPCNGPASRSMSAACVGGFITTWGMVSSSPTPRRRPPAPTSETSGRHCGPSCAHKASSRPTTKPNEPFVMGCCGVTPAFGGKKARILGSIMECFFTPNRHPQCRRQPFCRASAHGARYPAPATVQRPRLSQGGLSGCRVSTAGALAAASNPPQHS